jgi:O-methyltransferase
VIKNHAPTSVLQRLGQSVRSRPKIYRPLWLARHASTVYRAVNEGLEFEPSDRYRHEMADRKQFLRRAFHCLAFNGIEGDYAEFGCNGGMTFRLAWGSAALVDYPAHLWGFDSFEGLPTSSDERDTHPQWVPGTMATSADAFQQICGDAGIPPSAFTIVPGFYDSSLQPTAPGLRPNRVSLAYVDCDLYSSTRDVLAFLQPRLQHGAIIAFDDYYCYSPDAPSGERLAAAEHFAESDIRLVPYVQYGWHGMSFVVERRGAVPPAPFGW